MIKVYLRIEKVPLGDRGYFLGRARLIIEVLDLDGGAHGGRDVDAFNISPLDRGGLLAL